MYKRQYKGVIVFCRLMDGVVKKGTTIQMMATGFKAEVVEVGYFGAGQFIPCEELSAGCLLYTSVGERPYHGNAAAG